MDNNSGEKEIDGLKEVLKMALELEEKGYKYYNEVSGKASNPLTRNLFTVLAEQEVSHMDRIKQLYEESSIQISQATVPSEELQKALKQVFNNFSKEQRDTWDIDIEDAYEYAMQLENDSSKMYGDFAKKSKNSVETEFFKSLENEENAHFSALQNVYNYLKHTKGWFESEESKTWNWMVT